MKLARRLSVVEPSPTLAVSAKAAKLKAEGIDVVSFGAGEPDFDTPVHIKEAAKKALDAGATKYTLVEGTVPLRKAVAKWIGDAHGFAVEPNQVIVSSGAKQSIFNILGPPPGPVLDLYAGSGALGLESLSRGAPAAVFVERDDPYVTVDPNRGTAVAHVDSGYTDVVLDGDQLPVHGEAFVRAITLRLPE